MPSLDHLRIHVQRTKVHQSMYVLCMIDLAAVTSLNAVLEHGSVVGAADALHLSPSAVSQQVKRLERQVGLDLLERAGRGVIVTGHGRELINRCGPITRDIEALESALHAQADLVSGSVRVATFATAGRGFVAAALVQAGRLHPALSIDLTDREPELALQDVSAGRADLAVIHQWDGLPLSIPESIAVTPLFMDIADVVVDTEHPLARLEQLTNADLAGQQWTATPPGSICRRWLDGLFDQLADPGEVRWESWEFTTQIELVRNCQAVALIPRLGRGILPPDVRAIPLAEAIPHRELLAVHRETLDESPALQAVLGALRSQAPQGAKIEA